MYGDWYPKVMDTMRVKTGMNAGLLQKEKYRLGQDLWMWMWMWKKTDLSKYKYFASTIKTIENLLNYNTKNIIPIFIEVFVTYPVIGSTTVDGEESHHIVSIDQEPSFATPNT